MTTLIKNITIVNEQTSFIGNVYIVDELITNILKGNEEIQILADHIIDGTGKHLLPGIIDDQVHFRDPGLTEKASIYTESRAAAAGGVCSFMDMPNTRPACLTNQLLEQKYDIAAEHSLINYSFYLGASNDNINEVKSVDPKRVCGVKVFMGSSTGNMLVDQQSTLEAIFAESPILVATHCEDEQIIATNSKYYKSELGSNIPFSYHPLIRSTEACYKSSAKAVELAYKYNTQLHILHISTAKEIKLFEQYNQQNPPKITAEACVHHLWFTDQDYELMGAKIKCNPAIKTINDRDALRLAVANTDIAIVATDHAPHTLKEKQAPYFTAPSGLPLVQHSLLAMLEMVHQGHFTLSQIVRSMCHNPALIFKIYKRGFIKIGYYADLVIVDLNESSEVACRYKCGWSPFDGKKFSSSIKTTFVNGRIVYNGNDIIEAKVAKRLLFNR